MNNILQIATVLGLCWLTISCVPSESRAGVELHELFHEEWEVRLKESPEFATTLGDDRYNDRLSDISLEAIERRHQQAVETLTKLTAIKRSRLSEADQLNYDLFKKQMESRIQRYQYRDFLMPLDQMDGVQIDFPNLIDVTPFRSDQDYDNYLARLAAFPTYINQTIALMRLGIDEGMTQSIIVLRTVPVQIEAQFSIKVEESPFYKPFKLMPEDMPEGEKSRYRDEGTSAIKESVFASYKKLYEFFVDEYLQASRSDIAATSLPNGKEYYRFLVKHYTTTDLIPEEIHKIGLREVKRIREEMEQIIGDLKFKGTFDDFVQFLRTDPQFYYTSADELLDGYRIICKRIDPELSKLFSKLPRMPYGVRPIPDYQAPASPTAYYHPGAADGSRPGYFWANTYNLKVRPKYEMEALAIHEAVPGHHLQIALTMELEGIPKFRRYGGFTAFVEGWGLYSESLGEEMGFYSDPYLKFGQLTYEMWRACRLVVDTGMHELGWSRQEAIDFMMRNTAKTEHDITVEIDRYIAWPGQALAYKIGELKIKELRAMAEDVLGDDFDIREFHDVILGGGALPLDVLEQLVRAYVDSKGA